MGFFNRKKKPVADRIAAIRIEREKFERINAQKKELAEEKNKYRQAKYARAYSTGRKLKSAAYKGGAKLERFSNSKEAKDFFTMDFGQGTKRNKASGYAYDFGMGGGNRKKSRSVGQIKKRKTVRLGKPKRVEYY